MPDPPAWTKFAIAASSGASGWMFVHPMDVVKTRMQLLNASHGRWNAGGVVEKRPHINSVKMFADIGRMEGIKGMYSGLSAAITRQFTYTTARIGLYELIRDAAAPTFGIDSSPASLGSGKGLVLKLGSGLSAGALACVMCCPIEVALVRMQADASKHASERRNYRNVFTALLDISRSEGASGLWRGVGALVSRGAIVSMTQLASYDQAKGIYKGWGMEEGIHLHLASALTSGFLYCVVSLPIDTVKSRLMDSSAKEGEVAAGIRDTFRQVVADNGVMALWRGFPAYFARGGGHTVTMFLFMEQVRVCMGPLASLPSTPTPPALDLPSLRRTRSNPSLTASSLPPTRTAHCRTNTQYKTLVNDYYH